MEQFGTSGVPIPCRMKPTYGGTLVFSCLCSGLPLCHHYTDTSLIRQVSEYLLLYSEFQRAIFNGIIKRSLYWLGHLGAIYQRVLENNLHIPPEKTFTFAPCTKNFFSSGSRSDWHFGECSQKKSLPVVADENGNFRSVLRKIYKK